MNERLPIPASQLHYADPALNDEAQQTLITPFVDYVHYPTLGAPALRTADQTLSVVLSLPKGQDPALCSLWLVVRHEQPPCSSPGKFGGQLKLTGPAVNLGDGPVGANGQRTTWLMEASLKGFLPFLYDLSLQLNHKIVETQHNAVRVFSQITGNERIVLCGDSQFHEGNEVCLERFVERMNKLEDVAWIALIGDVCDNGVRGAVNLLDKATSAHAEPVRTYYLQEYPGARRRLANLNKPIVLVPGNHDGMSANELYAEGVPSTVYLGPDPNNRVVYDGLHYFRRTFGPLYFAFDWHKTRYLCTNTFELDRQQRLGYHAVVANWGGWMREEQLAWLRADLEAASKEELHKVVFMHHDPRGGSCGKFLGQYSQYRPFRYQEASRASTDYLKYLLTHVRSFQEEWMWWSDAPLESHPVQAVLSTLLAHKIWGVVMGHDNENWIESYEKGDNIFVAKPVVRSYPHVAKGAVDPKLVRDVADLIESDNMEAALALLKARSGGEAGREADEHVAEDVLAAAFERVAARSPAPPLSFGGVSGPGKWNLRAEAPIRFAHVNDVGGYQHSSERHFSRYGYVIAQLSEGRPVRLQSYNLGDGAAGPVTEVAD